MVCHTTVNNALFLLSVSLILIPATDEERPLMINYIIYDEVTNSTQKVHPQRPYSALQNVFVHYLGVFLHVDRQQF